MSEKRSKEIRKVEQSMDNGVPISTEKAKQVIFAAEKNENDQCMKEVQTVLNKWNRTLDVYFIIRANSNVPVVTVIKKV